jgi:hypothetical protein
VDFRTVTSKKFGLRKIIFFSSVKSEKKFLKELNFFAKLSKPQNWGKKKTPLSSQCRGYPENKKSETPTHHTPTHPPHESLYREQGAFMQYNTQVS